MCYSFNTSLISYTLGMISAIFCFCTRQMVLGMLILCYSQMQLSELIIWYGIDNKNDNINKAGTSFGKYFLPLHNAAIGIGIILSIIFISKRKLTTSDFIPLIVGIIFFVLILVCYYSKNKYQSITKQLDPSTCLNGKICQNSKNRLQWPYPHGWYMFSYIISLLLLLLFIKPLKVKIWLGSIFTITLLFTVLFVRRTVIGSMWCFSTAILAPIIAIIGYILTRNELSSNILI